MSATRRKSMSLAEQDAFVQTFSELLEEIGDMPEYSQMQMTLDLLRKAVSYNVPGGKQIRGRGVVAAYRELVESPDPNVIREAYILGWCIEIFQTCFLVINDLIENSETRRGQVCWYLVEDIGDMAISDGFLLSGLVNIVLDRYFSDKPYYIDLQKDFHNVHLMTALGQCMDTLSSKKSATCASSGYSMERYKKIVTYKTAYNSFYLPVVCAMRLANKTDPEIFKEIEKIVLEMGLLFQVQDDFLDCFGDPSVTGRVGTDICQNKYTWLIVKAFEKADMNQREILKDNYGLGQQNSEANERKVLGLYKDLGLREDFRKFEETSYASILDNIEKLSSKIPQPIFSETADLIYRRFQ